MPAFLTHRAPELGCGSVRGSVRYRSARWRSHMFLRAAGCGTHVTAAQECMTKTAVIKATVQRSHVPWSADMGGALVTSSPTVRARRRDVAAAIGGASGAAGSRAKRAAGGAVASIGTGDNIGVGKSSGSAADAGARRSRSPATFGLTARMSGDLRCRRSRRAERGSPDRRWRAAPSRGRARLPSASGSERTRRRHEVPRRGARGEAR